MPDPFFLLRKSLPVTFRCKDYAAGGELTAFTSLDAEDVHAER